MAVWTTPTAVHSKCGEEGSFPATNAKDDNTGTYWWHIATCYHWIIFDMGQSYSVTKIRLYQSITPSDQWGGPSGGLDVYISDDPTDWGSAVWTGLLGGHYWQETGAFQKNGRYVKLVSKENGITQRMNEFDAYCAEVEPPPPPPSAGALPIKMDVGPHPRSRISFGRRSKLGMKL